MAALLALVACSSDGQGKKPRRSSSASVASLSHSVPPPATTARLSTIPLGGPTSTPPPHDALSRKALAALLTVTDLNTSFTELPYTESPIPQPCAATTAKPVLTRVPPKARAGRQFSLSSPPGVLAENVYVLASPAQAAKLAAAAALGLHCTQGKFVLADGTTQSVKVDGPADIRAIVGVPKDAVSSWTLQNGKLTASFVVAVDKQVVVTLTFVAPNSAELAKLPPTFGPSIARAALTKIRTSGLTT